MPLVREQVDSKVYFVDDNKYGKVINGHEVLSFEEFLKLPSKSMCLCVAIADSSIRKTISERIQAIGISLFLVKAKNVVIMDEVTLGEGAILSPFVTLTSNIKTGVSLHANLYSYIGHDCLVGDYVTLAPGAKVNGNVILEDHVYIGSGAVIKQGTPDNPIIIGKGAIVGMGAVVTKSVPPNTVVVGNPSKALVKG